jgi:fatty acid desaturase
MRGYRHNHFAHHRHVNSARDPDWTRKQNDEWRFPMPARRLAKLLVYDVTGIGFVKTLALAGQLRAPGRARPGDPLVIGRIVFVAALVVALSVLHLWTVWLLFWVVPFVTWTQLCLHLRSMAEHFAVPASRPGPYAHTRTVQAGPLARLFLASKNINYHLEHHLYPSVPFYNLPALHRLLMETPEHRAAAHVSRGYAGVLGELVRPRPAADRA